MFDTIYLQDKLNSKNKVGQKEKWWQLEHWLNVTSKTNDMDRLLLLLLMEKCQRKTKNKWQEVEHEFTSVFDENCREKCKFKSDRLTSAH